MKLTTKRIVSTIFWEDSYIKTLSTDEKLLFLFFLTNDCATVCGIYELSLKKIISLTGILASRVTKILKKFDDDNKILRIEEWICIKNFIKHSDGNIKIKKKIEELLLLLPDTLVEKLIERGWEKELLDWDQIPTSIPRKRGIEYTKENFIGEDYVREMLSSPRKNIRIIAMYWIKRDIIPPTYLAAKKMIARDLRAAASLMGYDEKEINAGFTWLDHQAKGLKTGKAYTWNLGTMMKKIDEFRTEYKKWVEGQT